MAMLYFVDRVAAYAVHTIVAEHERQYAEADDGYAEGWPAMLEICEYFPGASLSFSTTLLHPPQQGGQVQYDGDTGKHHQPGEQHVAVPDNGALQSIAKQAIYDDEQEEWGDEPGADDGVTFQVGGHSHDVFSCIR